MRIKKCPFCGGDGWITSAFNPKWRTKTHFVKCEICGATGRKAESDDSSALEDVEFNAICYWNEEYEGDR